MNLDDQLLTEAKVYARRSGKTLTALVEDALRERLARRGPVLQTEWTRLPTVGGGGLLPGVDLDDSSSLLDIMDGLA